MKKIAILSDRIFEEIEDAEFYANLALEYQTIDKALADTAWTIASQEVNHVDMLHAQEVRMIKEEEVKGTKVPEGMMMVYEDRHKAAIKAATHAKWLLSQYKK